MSLLLTLFLLLFQLKLNQKGKDKDVANEELTLQNTAKKAVEDCLFVILEY
jgi:hypothetical protein